MHATPTGYTLLGQYRSVGFQDFDTILNWNGRPISETNRPTDEQRQLKATVNLYAFEGASNEMFFQVTDVVSTRFGFALGSTFDGSTLTGIRFNLGGAAVRTPDFSNNYANPGQFIQGPQSGQQTPTSTTPGWGLNEGPGPNKFSIQTSDL